MIPRGYRKRLQLSRGRLQLGWLRYCGRLARFLGFRSRYNHLLAARVRDTGLFDADWYLEENPDVRESCQDPLLHYVRFGDREGRCPTVLFDPAYYRAAAPGFPRDSLGLLHYVLVGRHLKVPTSPWFDTEFYLRQNRDVAHADVDPLRHFLCHGGAEGRSPCRQFDAAWYLQAYGEVLETGQNPLLHFLTSGRLQGHSIAAAHDDGQEHAPTCIRPGLPADLGDVRIVRAAAEALVDVVVPVFRGLGETMRCLHSVLEAENRTAFELVVVDDASPDEALATELRHGATRGLFTLLRNDTNLGFVVSANRGMMLHPDRDVVLLNADTEVFGDWLDRLRAAAHRAADVATVTPLSNNATIASYPRFLQDNPHPLEISYRELDRLAAATNAGQHVETPTGVGFCLYLRRDGIDAIGLFDEVVFGRGYGEENDYCQRAIAAGRRNLIAADVFVHHVGSVSFQGERAKGVERAMRVMERRHPLYEADIRRFREADPLAPMRYALDHARLGRFARERNVLMVCHNRGGGAERHLREDAERLQAQGYGVLVLRPVPGAPQLVRIMALRNIALPNIPPFALETQDALVALLRGLGVSLVHVHGTVDFDASAPDRIVELARAIDATLEVEIHDYQVICPRINLAGVDGRYCGEPDEAGCDRCLASNGSKYNTRSIRAWRESHAGLMHAAQAVWAPDIDPAERLLRYFPGAPVRIDAHEEIDAAHIALSAARLGVAEPLHVVVIGAINKVKGYDVLLACARTIRARKLPVRITLLGYSASDRVLRLEGVEITGKYHDREAQARLATLGAHVAWLPSLWPETYSYTLSVALRGGLPVFAFDIGAIASRLRAIGRAQHLMPLALQGDVDAMLRQFLDYRAACAAPA